MTRHSPQQELDLLQEQLIGALGGGSVNTAATESTESLAAMVDDRLRGRWRYMIALGIVLAGVFAVLGWRSTMPMFRSTASILVISDRGSVLYEIPEIRTSNPGKFKITQMELITSRRVLEAALRSPEMQQLSWTSSPAAVDRLAAGLTVESAHNSDLIVIAYEAEDAVTAQVATNAVLHAYHDIYGDQGGARLSSDLQKLEDLAAKHERALRLSREDVQRIVTRHGTNDLDALHAEKAQALRQVEQQLEMSMRFRDRLATRDGNDAASDVPPPSLDELEAFDPRLADLRQQRDNAQTEFELVQRRFHEQSSQYRVAEARSRASSDVFEAHAAKVLERYMESGGIAMPGDLDPRLYTPERLDDDIDMLLTEANELRGELTQILADMQALENNRYERDFIQQELQRTRDRMQALETERQNITNVVSIAQEGFKPHGPYSDGRKKRAAAGFIGGFVISFGLFFLIGTIDRRTFGARQLRSGAGVSLRCLGVLPDLGDSMTDPESSEVASHCVHQIRNQIEAMRARDAHGYVIGVSSPFQGDGKTSIVMALGWSYAAAGHRTCLVDIDLVGRSLTRQLGLTGLPGVREIIANRTVDDRIAPLPVQNLSAVPVGVDSRFGPETIRRTDLELMFDALRDRFDVIIADTGPLLGSLESTPVAAASDGVILSVRRGRSRTRLDECVQRLESVGANGLGVILNCAERGDVVRYVSEASLTAAEERAATTALDGTTDSQVIRVSSHERNALLLAMETSTRVRSDDDDSQRPISKAS